MKTIRQKKKYDDDEEGEVDVVVDDEGQVEDVVEDDDKEREDVVDEEGGERKKNVARNPEKEEGKFYLMARFPRKTHNVKMILINKAPDYKHLEKQLWVEEYCKPSAQTNMNKSIKRGN